MVIIKVFFKELSGALQGFFSKACSRCSFQALLQIFVVCLLAAPHMAYPADLRHALERLSNHPTILSAKERYAKAMLARFYAVSGALPNASLDIMKDFDPISVNPSAFPIENQTVVMMRVSQPIFSFGSTLVSYQKADKSVMAAKNQFIEVEQKVVFDAAKAYLSVIRARKVVQINEKNKNYLHEFLEQAEQRFKKGELTKTDVAIARSKFESAVSSLIDARNSLADAESLYTYSVGEPPSYELIAPRDNIKVPDRLDGLLREVFSSNPSIITALYSYKAKQDEVKIQSTKLLPSLHFSSQYTRSPSSAPDFTMGMVVASGFTWALNLNLPILSRGGIDYIDLQGAKYDMKSAFYDYKEALRSVDHEAVAAWSRLNTSRSTVISNQEALRAAEIALEGVKREFLAGFRTSFDVLAAEQQFLDASLRVHDSIYNCTLALYSVMRVMGGLTIQKLLLSI